MGMGMDKGKGKEMNYARALIQSERHRTRTYVSVQLFKDN
jgi:hypothetical protein